MPLSLPEFQAAVDAWVLKCFNEPIRNDKIERGHRCFEEATEVAQAMGVTREDCHTLVDYVFNRPVGEPFQEVGGLLLCLAALCNAIDVDLQEAAATELARDWGIIDKVRQKHNTKPGASPLPGTPPPE